MARRSMPCSIPHQIKSARQQTYSFFHHAELLKLLSESALLSVPGKAAVRISVSRRGMGGNRSKSRKIWKDFLPNE